LCCTAPLWFAACGDDDDDDDGGKAGSAAAGKGGSGGAKAGSGGKGGSGGAKAGSGGSGDGAGTADDGCDLSGEGKEKEAIPNPTGSMTLTSDKVWELEGVVRVADGETLTIEACTRIEGKTGATPGTLVVARGGRIEAVGTADEPILFTSSLAPGSRAAGNWGGVILLGKAPNFKGDAVLIEGLADDPENQHGGDVEDDNSGTLSYVRIEFGGFELTAGNEINGLTMGSVGSGTTINHIMVNTSLDDCFEWFGGTVDADHLVCNGGGDDMFDADDGYIGKLEYLFGRQRATSSMDPNGFEWDSNAMNTDPPVSNVTATHATLCGTGEMGTAVTRGMVLRENITGAIDDLVVTGFDIGADTRNPFGTPEEPRVTITKSLIYGGELAETEVGTDSTAADYNDDADFDEVAWFEAGDGNSSDPDPVPFTTADCQDDDGPAAKVLDSDKGAFTGEPDWLDGAWIDWSED